MRLNLLVAWFKVQFSYAEFVRLSFTFFCRKLLLVWRKLRNQWSQKWLFVKAIWILKGLVSECCRNFRVYSANWLWACCIKVCKSSAKRKELIRTSQFLISETCKKRNKANDASDDAILVTDICRTLKLRWFCFMDWVFGFWERGGGWNC